MTVNTSTLEVLSWTRISNGSETVSMQVLSSEGITIVDADSAPSPDVRGRIYGGGAEVVITPPTMAWVRPLGDSAWIVVDRR